MQNENKTDLIPDTSPGGGWASKRKLWFGAAALVLAVIVALVLVWVLPSSGNGAGVEEEDASTRVEKEEAVGEEEPVEAGGEQQGGERQETEQQGHGSVTVTPKEDSSGYVVEFPDPADAPDEPAPGEEGYTDIAGAWIMDMSGSIYGVTNCHLLLEDGRITAPDDYDQVFEIMDSAYSWDKGSSTFEAGLVITVKLGSGGISVPASLELTGKVADSMTRIEGDFHAVPQGEAYAMYGEEGAFVLSR